MCIRDRANFGVLEGFLTVLLGEKIQIMEILESEGNQQREDDKFNRVDIRARNSKDEIILVEVQNTRELYYLERILYGVAKAITEHIDLGGIYANVKKVYSISILYFDIGQGNDYLYHGQKDVYKRQVPICVLLCSLSLFSRGMRPNRIVTRLLSPVLHLS